MICVGCIVRGVRVSGCAYTAMALSGALEDVHNAPAAAICTMMKTGLRIAYYLYIRCTWVDTVTTCEHELLGCLCTSLFTSLRGGYGLRHGVGAGPLKIAMVLNLAFKTRDGNAFTMISTLHETS